MTKLCSIAGCYLKVNNYKHFICTKCWHKYVIGGVVPPWLTELVNMSRREESANKQFRKHETLLTDYYNTKRKDCQV